MACVHPVAAGYAFCAQCGEPSPAPRCRCGFVAAAADLFCGGCGRNLRADAGSSAATAPRAGRSPLLDLARLAAQADADQALASPTRKAKLGQDEIRKMVAARRRKA